MAKEKKEASMESMKERRLWQREAEQLIWQACARTDPGMFERALGMGASIDAKSNTGMTPLMDAVIRGERGWASWLLEKGASLKERDPRGRSALEIARAMAKEVEPIQGACKGMAEAIEAIAQARDLRSESERARRNATDHEPANGVRKSSARL